MNRLFPYITKKLLLLTWMACIAVFPVLSQESISTPTSVDVFESYTTYSPNIENLGLNVQGTDLTLAIEPDQIIYSITQAITFKLILKNVSNNIHTIKLSDDYTHNVFLDVYDELQLPVPITPQLLVRRSEISPYRSISLYPGEEFITNITLNDFVDISKLGTFKVEVRFYLEQYVDTQVSQQNLVKREAQYFIESNPVLISIISEEIETSDDNVYNDNYTDIYQNNYLITREYSPYDVVTLSLNELKQHNWDEFLKYVDIVDLYTNSTHSSIDSFNTLSSSERRKSIINFVSRLKTGNEFSDLSPPQIFSIDETRYTQFNGVVTVTAKIAQQEAIQMYRYKFILEKKSTGWKIVNYVVQYIGLDSSTTNETKQLGNALEYKFPGELE